MNALLLTKFNDVNVDWSTFGWGPVYRSVTTNLLVTVLSRDAADG